MLPAHYGSGHQVMYQPQPVNDAHSICNRQDDDEDACKAFLRQLGADKTCDFKIAAAMTPCDVFKRLCVPEIAIKLVPVN